MTHRIGLAALAMVAWSALWFPASAQERAPDLFAEPKIWPLHITIPAKEYEAMQPAGGGPMGFFGGPKQPAPKPMDGRETHRNAFGMDLPLAYGSLVADGMMFPKIGVRYKGNGTIMDAMGTIKKSLKLDLNRYNEDLRFHGLKTINLNSGVADPTKGRETLGYAAYRRAGVPAPRTTFAEVTLTVPGKYDREYLGLYTILESVDKGFLKSHFKNDQGLLLKPERAGGLNYFGDEWERYKTTYQPKRDATPDEAKRVIAFTKLVNLSSNEQFQKEIESYLDVDAFLRFMAVTAMIVNVDSFFTLGHNYLLYLHPETNKFHFIPWDLDRAFANHPLFGSPDQQMDMNIAKPYSQCRLPDRLLAVKEYRDRQQTILKETAATFTKAQLLKDIDAFEKITKDIIAKGATAAAARNERGPGGPGGFGPPGGGPFGRVPDLRTFAETRTKSIEAQLAGKSTGYTIAMGFGGFGPPPGDVFGPPGGMGPANLFAKPLLDRMDVNKAGKVTEAEFVAGMKKLFAEWDKDKNGAVDQRELTEGLQRLMPGPQMGPFPGGFPGALPGGPPGKGPPGGIPGQGPK